MVAKSADFLGINYYTSGFVYPTPTNQIDLSHYGWIYDSDVTKYQDTKWYK
jgi:beta-glucosidase/6-phospho-beta-glucosidase/beta-galactosidase